MNNLASLVTETEKEFQAKVLHYAHLNGWLCYHTFDSRRSANGFPDLVLVRGGNPTGELIFAELKTAKGRVSQAQQGWIDVLSTTEAQAYIFRPADWPVIESVLRRRRG